MKTSHAATFGNRFAELLQDSFGWLEVTKLRIMSFRLVISVYKVAVIGPKKNLCILADQRYDNLLSRSSLWFELFSKTTYQITDTRNY